MERITRNNYEAFFLDYLDGQMTPEQEQELQRFLDDHPDLRQELSGLEHTLMAPAGMELSFPDKDRLKKSLTLGDAGYTHLDELCIARMEGDLSAGQQEEFDQLLRDDPQKQKTFQQYEQTRLQPDPSVILQHKNRLKKGAAVPLFIKRNAHYLAMAATVLLLAGLHLFFPAADNLELPSGVNGLQTSRVEPVVSAQETPVAEPVKANTELLTDDMDYHLLNAGSVQPTPAEPQSMTREEASLVQDAMQRIQPRRAIPIKEEPVLAQLQEPTLPLWRMNNGSIQFDTYQKMDRILDRQVAYALQNTIREPQFSLWDIADLGLDGISKLTGKELSLERHYNKQGKLQKLAFRTESFAMSTRLQ